MKLKVIFLLLLISLTTLSFVSLQAYAGNYNLLKVYFLDVGQGDSELIQAPNGNTILIDGGPTDSVLSDIGLVMPFKRTIDVVILTHPHADHVTGLIEVLKRYQVKTIIESQQNYANGSYAMWNELKPNYQVIQARAGQSIDLGSGVVFHVLYPYTSAPQDVQLKNPHDFMVVGRLTYGKQAIVFTGDMEAKVEQELIDNNVDVSAQFLKIGHHGSKTSSSEQFLNSVHPNFGFIEVGAQNRYGHPHKIILDRLDAHSIKYYRTDQDGTSELILDGQNYQIKHLNHFYGFNT